MFPCFSGSTDPLRYALTKLGKGGVPLCLGLTHDLPEVSLGRAKDRIEPSHRFLEDMNAMLQHVENTNIDGIPYREVENLNNMFLTNSVHPSDSLLNSHRVPGQVIIHKHMAELKISPLSSRFGANQNLRPDIVPESSHGAVFANSVKLPVKYVDSPPLSNQKALKIALSLSELREDNYLAVVLVASTPMRPRFMAREQRIDLLNKYASLGVTFYRTKCCESLIQQRLLIYKAIGSDDICCVVVFFQPFLKINI